MNLEFQLVEKLRHVLYQYNLEILRPSLALSDDTHVLGSFDARLKRITVSRWAIRNYPWYVVVQILKHELAHMLVDHWGLSDEDPHGAVFQRACLAFGVLPWARTASIELPSDNPHSGLESEESPSERKLRKLLALTNSPNLAEAKLAAERAAEIVAKCVERSPFDVLVTETGKKRLQLWHSKMIGVVQRATNVDVIFDRNPEEALRGNQIVIEWIGERHALRNAEYLYLYLLRTIPAIAHEESRLNARIDKRGFMLGVVDGFAKTFAVPLETRKALVPSTKERGNFFRQLYPKVRSRHAKGACLDLASYDFGTSRGRCISAPKPLESTFQALLEKAK